MTNFERALVGGVLLAPGTTDTLVEDVPIAAFTDVRLGEIYAAAVEVYRRMGMRAAVEFLRHLLAERLGLSADDAFRLVCSEFVLGESRAIMTETELAETVSQSGSMGIDLGFLLPPGIVAR